MAKSKTSTPYNKFLANNTNLFNTSALNYKSTEADLTKTVNDQIDDNIADMNNHFDQLIRINNQNYRNQQNNINQLISLTPKAVETAKWWKAKSEADALTKGFVDVNALQKHNEDIAETSLLEDESALMSYNSLAAAGELERTNLDPDLEHELKTIRLGTTTEKEGLALATLNYAKFFEKGRDTAVNENGLTFGTATTLQEANSASRELARIYVQDLLEAGFSPRLVQKYAVEPLYQDHLTRLKKWSEDKTAAQRTAAKDFRKDELITSLQTSDDASGLERWMKTYHGYFGSWAGAREEAFSFITDSVISGELHWKDAEKILDHEIIGNDNQPHIVSEYWKKEASNLRKVIREKRTAEHDADQEERELKQLDFKKKELDIIRSNSIPPTEEYMLNLQKQHIASFGKKADWIDDYITKQDIEDDVIEADLKRRYRKGETILPEDLDGIKDDEMWETWIKIAKTGGLNKDQLSTRNKWLDGQVMTYTEDETLEKGKGNPLFIAVRDQAEDVFNAKYRLERELGQTHEIAFSLAQQETSKVIKGGTLDSYPILERDEKRANTFNKLYSAIAKDPTILDSPNLLEGEEPELKAALDYIKKGKGEIPEFYRAAARFVKNKTPRELMVDRLILTGVLKQNEVEPIPERNLEPKKQDLLLHKPSPARSNRAFIEALVDANDVENIEELVELTGADSVEQLLEALREKAQRNNQLNGWEISQVNIDPTLMEEHTQVVGEESPFNNLNTLLPGVATAYVEDKYNV